jgi:simple sugar transport system substrate-binding protein
MQTRKSLMSKTVRWVGALSAAGLVIATLLPITSASAASKTIKIIDVNGPKTDPFFGPVSLGAVTAGKLFGVDLEYSSPANEDNLAGDMSTLMNQAIAEHPSAIVMGDYVPSAFGPLIKKAEKDGIPVVVMNAGESTWQADGAIAFVGQDFTAAGVAGGKEALADHVHNLLCVNSAPTNPAIHQTCLGAAGVMKAAGGTEVELDIPIADQTSIPAMTTDIQGFLASHKSIDGIDALGSEPAPAAVDAVKALGKLGKIAIGTINVSTLILQDIQNGTISWCVDQQPYLQGFDSVQIAAQYVQYGIVPSSEVLTAGLIIDKKNVKQVEVWAKDNPGVRGAA